MNKDVQTHIQLPLLNNSHHDAVLKPKATLGSLHQIQSILIIEPLMLINKEKQLLVHQSNAANTAQSNQEVLPVNKRDKTADDHV